MTAVFPQRCNISSERGMEEELEKEAFHFVHQGGHPEPIGLRMNSVKSLSERFFVALLMWG